MATYAEGTFPVVFESGVCVFDEDGTLHVHCLHTDTDPHPMATHPEGEDCTVDLEVHEAVLQGTTDIPRVSGRFPRSSEIPKGLTFTFRNYQFAQLEASGDLSILVTGVDVPPVWFSPGKVHRFAREALAVCLHDDSIDPTVPKKSAAGPTPAAKGPKKRVSPLAGEADTIGQRVPDDTSAGDEKKATETSGTGASKPKGGCAALALLPVLAVLAVAIPALLQ